MTDDPTAFAVALFGSNLAYIFGTVLIALFYSVTPAQMLQGPFTTDLAGVWLAIGGLLGAADVAALLSLFSGEFSGGGR